MSVSPPPQQIWTILPQDGRGDPGMWLNAGGDRRDRVCVQRREQDRNGQGGAAGEHRKTTTGLADSEQERKALDFRRLSNPKQRLSFSRQARERATLPFRVLPLPSCHRLLPPGAQAKLSGDVEKYKQIMAKLGKPV